MYHLAIDIYTMKRRRIGAALATTLAVVAAASTTATAAGQTTTLEEDHDMLIIDQEEYHPWDDQQWDYADEHYDYDYDSNNDPYYYNDLNQDDNKDTTDAAENEWDNDNQLEWDLEAASSG